MADRAPLAGASVLAAVLAVLALVGGVLGVGPLASTIPPDRVTDPVEMVRRSVQAVIDTNSVHVKATLDGRLPGALLGRDAPSATLDGTTASVDVLPHDAKTHMILRSPTLDVALETVSVWDDLWHRGSDDAQWTKASLGALSADAGLDINPLTLPGRIHDWIVTSGRRPTVTDVACRSASGRCHRVVVEAGDTPSSLLAAMLPAERTASLPPVDTRITLDTDAKTLRPAHVEVAMRSEDGTIDLRLVADASAWDEIVLIEEPSPGS